MTCKFSATKTATMAVATAMSLGAATLPAHAANPYNTGIDPFGNPIADGNTTPNWLVCYDPAINGCPTPTNYAPATVVNSPLPAGWLANTSDSNRTYALTEVV